MKRTLFLCVLLFLLGGCAKAQDTTLPTTVPETVSENVMETQPQITEESVAETTVPEETVFLEEQWYYPSRRTVNGREVYDFGMELFNDTESALTVVSMHVADYVSEAEVAAKSYSGWELDVFNGDRPPKYTMEPGYPLVLFMEENVGAVTFDTRVITILLQTETGEPEERVFRFRVDDEAEACRPDPEEAQWQPAVLEFGGWKFPCGITNDTDQLWTFTGMYSLQYINSNPVRFSYRLPGDSYMASIAQIGPGETVIWTDGIAAHNMFATHRKYVVYYEDPQGTVYEKVFHFTAEKEQ